MGLAHCCQEKQEKTDLKCISIKRISHSNTSLMPRLEQIKNRTNDCFLTPTTQTRMKQNSYNNTPIHPKTHSKTLFREEEKKKRTPEDFQQIRYLGKGAFGCVVLVRQKASGCKYAIKIIQKSKIKEFNLLQCDRIKEIGLQNFFVTIKQTFQNQTNIYIVMQYLPVGDLYYYLLKKETPFTQDVIAKIISEIIVSIEYLHSKGIIYRELKPQNLLITDQGHIKLTDYGLSKVIIENRKSIQTFVGTIQYMAPQALVGGFGQKADIWSIGMLMYELFFKQNLMELDDSRITMILKGGVFPIEKQVIQNKINSKIGFMSLKFRDLLLKILDKDPEKRISLQKMKSHDFFKGINWKSVELRQNEPPLKELIQKKSLMRFRDPTIEKRYRNEFVKERTLKENYQFELYQFCISQ